MKMITREFTKLMSYARFFGHTEDDADELVLLAYQESLRLGKRCTFALLVNHMRLCARSISDRSFLALDEAGKSRLDAFNKAKCYLSDPVADNSTVENVIASNSTDPFDEYVALEFVDSLTHCENMVLSELASGYSVREICKNLRMSSKTFEKVRVALQEKSGSYL